MYCKNCGATTKEGEKFCSSCGNNKNLTNDFKKPKNFRVPLLVIIMIIFLVLIITSMVLLYSPIFRLK